MEQYPLLSVCLITYNHFKYIKQAIDGVLMQKVDFSWELIIADDFSTDGTREILLEYKKKYPQFITLILQEKNVGAAQNWLDLITSPKSKYIAYLEGDDYWTDENKLQKQIDFLEENEGYSGCFHYTQILNEDAILGRLFTVMVSNKVLKHPLAFVSVYFTTPTPGAKPVRLPAASIPTNLGVTDCHTPPVEVVLKLIV